MCGIAGYYGRRTVDDTRVRQTLDLMKRRGPDGQQSERVTLSGGKNAVLLHSRLSIIDLESRANQPFHYKNKVLIFNGEIYNYIEVRERLEKAGHIFTTESDTEVLIHALDEWDIDALNIIQGMWSFALVEKNTGRLLLSRDPFGEKPLHIYQPEPGELYFASEVKFLSSLSGVAFRPNVNHICRFMVNGYKSVFKGQEGFFLNVQNVSYGSYLEISPNGAQRLARYWTPRIQTNSDMTFDDAVHGTRERLIESVRIRLRSDVPIAFCMSGGIDSNSLISIARRVLDYDVAGFTILNSDSRYEEQDMIDVGVRELGIRHHGQPISSENFLEKLKALVTYHDAPVLTISFYLNWLLQEQISAAGYKISISGTAADEIFSGYFDHHLFYLHDIRGDAVLLEKSVANWQRDIAPIVRNPFLQDPFMFINRPFERGNAYLGHEKYSSYLTRPWHESFDETYFRDGLLQNRMMNEIFHETTPVTMHDEDLNAMYYSIENRSPFLDRDLFEFAHSIPARHLVRNGAAKAVLREAMRGIVPDAILDNKRKVGFNAPINDLLAAEGDNMNDYLLQDSPIWDIVKREPIQAMIYDTGLPNSDSKFLFSFLSAKMFMEQFS